MNPDRRAEIEASHRGLYLNPKDHPKKDTPQDKEPSQEERFRTGARWLLTGSIPDHNKIDALVGALTKLYQKCLKMEKE